MQFEAAEALLKSIVKFNEVKDGDSGDDEHDAAVELRDDAFNYLLASTGRDVELSELIDRYKLLIDEQESC